MKEYEEHYHCFLCGDRYPTKERPMSAFGTTLNLRSCGGLHLNWFPADTLLN